MPRAEDDTSLRSQPYGAETETQQFVEETGGPGSSTPALKQIQIPVQFDQAVPPVPDVGEEAPMDPDIIDGLGDVNDFLFGDTQRPEESMFALPDSDTPEPQGVSPELLQLSMSPGISEETRIWLEFLIRNKILGA